MAMIERTKARNELIKTMIAVTALMRSTLSSERLSLLDFNVITSSLYILIIPRYLTIVKYVFGFVLSIDGTFLFTRLLKVLLCIKKARRHSPGLSALGLRL